MTNPGPPGLLSTDVDLAADRLARGGVVAVPTETVYGLAADADQPGAVELVYELKDRPRDHPLIVHLSDPAAMAEWAVPDERAESAARCWPGPLTVLLPRTSRTPDIVTGGRPTVGLRVPQHAMTLELIDRLGDRTGRAPAGLAAPSANRFGRVSPTRADHVLTDIGDRLRPGRDLVLDGGPSSVGLESSILDLSVRPAQLLRAGALSADELAEVIGDDVAAASGPSRASGMLTSHYAPRCPVVLVGDAGDVPAAISANGLADDDVAILDASGNLAAAARSLYDDLRAADLRGAALVLAVLPQGDDALAVAIRDRLTKAAAERSGPSRAR